MDRIAILFFATLGIGCIWVGYQLLCGQPPLGTLPVRSSRTAVFLMNIVPGAVLTLIGASILTVETCNLVLHRQPMQHLTPSIKGSSGHPGSTVHSPNPSSFS